MQKKFISNLALVLLRDQILLLFKVLHGGGEGALEGLALCGELLDLLGLPEALLRVLLLLLFGQRDFASQPLVLLRQLVALLLELASGEELEAELLGARHRRKARLSGRG